MVAWGRVVAMVMKMNGPLQAIILKGESCGFSNWLYGAWRGHDGEEEGSVWKGSHAQSLNSRMNGGAIC